MSKYNFLIVGSGLFGAVFTYICQSRGYKCLVVEKRNHIAGNIYTENIEGIEVHKYGAHIFHTKDKEVWEFVNKFSNFNSFINSPIANFQGELYNLPFNMNTFYQIWKVRTPEEAFKKIEQQKLESNITNPKNLEEQAISLVGVDIYEKLIKGYTEKQWGRSCKDLPASIIKRIPVRFTFDNNYFADPYQGIPEDGYTKIIEKMLNGTEVRLNVDFLENKSELSSIADKIIFTGPIDGYFNYCFGPLEYRKVRFENEVLDCRNYQGVAVVNYTDKNVPYTRIIEHKHFTFGQQSKTVISREYPDEWRVGEEPYYPITNEKNLNLYKRYAELAANEKNVIFGGRLGHYKYYDMDKVIREALNLATNVLSP